MKIKNDTVCRGSILEAELVGYGSFNKTCICIETQNNSVTQNVANKTAMLFYSHEQSEPNMHIGTSINSHQMM